MMVVYMYLDVMTVEVLTSRAWLVLNCDVLSEEESESEETRGLEGTRGGGWKEAGGCCWPWLSLTSCCSLDTGELEVSAPPPGSRCFHSLLLVSEESEAFAVAAEVAPPAAAVPAGGAPSTLLKLGMGKAASTWW